MEYSSFASCYDVLMKNAEYEKRAEYMLSLFSEFDRAPTLLLDLACGTGGFTAEFLKHGIDVIGADPSAEMLEIAAKKLPNALFLQQSAEELNLFGTVDGAVCCMDSVNHITDIRRVKKAFSRVSLFLEPQRLFVFDVNTVYKHKSLLADNAYVIEEDNVFCSWQNSTVGNLTDIMLDFFVEDNGVYIRSSDFFSERAYTVEQLEKALCETGFRVEAVFGDMTHKKPKKKEERIYFVARKVF